VVRPQSRYVCQSCAESFLRWEGQCRACGSWNSLVETVVRAPSTSARAAARAAAAPGAAVPASLARIGTGDAPRLRVGIGELDRVLGGGLVPGSLVLVGGEPGVGKSTLLLQAAAGIALVTDGGPILYATGEESPAQVRLRADRLGLLDGVPGEAIQVVPVSDVGRIIELARTERPALVIVDSIQTTTVEELDGAAGSVGQVREATLRLMELAKGDGVAVVLAGHVTKDGSIAGPRTLEHLVDVVLNLEGDRHASLRLLRTTKNRFGSTEEVGVFEMRENGLSEVADPARAFLAEHDVAAPGSVVASTLEGSRPLLVEVQALTAPAGYGAPMRKARGLDANRLSLLIAVLSRRAGVGLSGHDVYANLAGGLTVEEPGLDLPLALALASSLLDRPVMPALVSIGEVGLLGELRGVAGLERRLREAARLGFRRAVVPRQLAGGAPEVDGIEILLAGSLRDAVDAALEPAGGADGTRRRAERLIARAGPDADG
jgi:DNA repair protein RadA/Sms